MRDTKYAREIATGCFTYDNEEARIERLFVKALNQEEIRFSWWKNGKMAPRPLDLPEKDLLKLLESGFEDVFSMNFLISLKSSIEKHIKNNK